MEHDDVNFWADTETFSIFTSRMASDAMTNLPNFFWCRKPGCKPGQSHEAAKTQPMILCVACKQRFCFQHTVAWHETMSCEEYEFFVTRITTGAA